MDVERSTVLENILHLFSIFNSWSVRFTLLAGEGIQYHLVDLRHILVFHLKVSRQVSKVCHFKVCVEWTAVTVM